MLRTKVYENVSEPFPTITICSNRIYTGVGVIRLLNGTVTTQAGTMPTLSEFTTTATQQIESMERRGLTAEAALLGYLGWVRGYYQSLNRRQIDMVAHNHDDMLLKGMCYVWIRNGRNTGWSAGTEVHHCDTTAAHRLQIYDIYNQKYLKCTRIRLHPARSSDVLGVMFAVFLDKDVRFNCLDCALTDSKTMSEGMTVSVTPPEVYTDGYRDVLVRPGSYFSLEIKSKRVKRLNTPKYRCVEQSNITKVNLNGELYSYSKLLCRRREQQRLTLERCRCSRDDLWAQNSSSLPPCGKVDNINNLDQIVRKTDLLRKLRCQTHINTLEFKSCPDACTSVQYDLVESQTVWPVPDLAVQLVHTILEKKKQNQSNPWEYFANKFSKLVELGKKYDELKKENSSLQMEELLLELDKEQQKVFRNFILFDIYRKDLSITEHNENTVVDLPSFLAQIGGLFSIFIGLTFVTFMEIIELCINFVRKLNRKRIDKAVSRPIRRNNAW